MFNLNKKIKIFIDIKQNECYYINNLIIKTLMKTSNLRYRPK